MDHRQSTMQLGGGGGGAATQEWLHTGGRQQPVQVVDGAFLMELLEDAPAAEQQPEDVDQLSRVIQSLEAEIGGGQPASAPANGGSKTEYKPSDDVDCGLDDMLSDLDSSSPGLYVADSPQPFEYWAEVPPAVGHDTGGWYVDGEGVLVGGYEFGEQCYYGYGESLAVEQVYSPLWE